MTEKRKFILNCDVCDARKIKEDELSSYDEIMINSVVLLIDESSKAILNQLPTICNTGETLEIDGEVNAITVNGNYEIDVNANVSDKSLLIVNGNLIIHPDTEDVIQKFVKIIVNGSVRCPKCFASRLNNISVNGITEYIPNDCTVLKTELEVDKYFPLRAKENRKYYASNKVLLIDPDIDIEMLTAKNVKFTTKRLICMECFASKVIEMIDENTELNVVPTGYEFIGKDAVLDETLLQKHGKCLYIDGNLTLNAESDEVLPQIEKLYVNGEVRLLKRQKERFEKLNVKYKRISFIKGRILRNKTQLTLDSNLLNASPDGISVINCRSLKISDDIDAISIMNLINIENCVIVKCSPQQRSAVESVSKNVANISSDDSDENSICNSFDLMHASANDKVVNANKYIL